MELLFVSEVFSCCKGKSWRDDTLDCRIVRYVKEKATFSIALFSSKSDRKNLAVSIVTPMAANTIEKFSSD